MNPKQEFPQNLPEPSPEKAPKPWTADETVKLIIDSFRFSQGLIPLQQAIFELLVIKFPERALAPVAKDNDILEMSEEIAKGIVLGPKTTHPKAVGATPITSERIKQELQIQLGIWRTREQYLRSKPPSKKELEKIKLKLAAWMLAKDLKFDNNYFYDYIMDGKPARIRELDLIFKDVRDCLESKGVVFLGSGNKKATREAIMMIHAEEDES